MVRHLFAAIAIVLSAAPALALEPSPQVTQVIPSLLPARGGVLVTVRGSNFVRAHGMCLVSVGARTVQPQSVTPTQLVFACPSPLPSSSFPITVIAPDGQKSTPRLVDGAAPVIVSISAPSAPRSGGTLITIYGHDFTAAFPTVDFSGTTMRPFSANDTAIVVNTAPNGTAGPLDVSVHALAASPAVPLIPTGPRITSIDPPSVARQGGTPLTIYGSNFQGTTRVEVGGAEAEFQLVSPTEVHAIAPPQNVKVTAVELKTTERSNPATAPVNGAPVITGRWPSAIRSVGSTNIHRLTIVGHNFGAAPLVTVNGSPVFSTAQVSPSQLRCEMPPGAGTASIAVTNTDGLTGGSTLDYLPPPTITNISPATVPNGAGTLLTITGTNFGPNDDTIDRYAWWDAPSGPQSRLRWVAPGVLTCPTPPGATGSLLVVIDEIDSQRRSIIYSGNASPPPVITSREPALLPARGGTLTIHGTNFQSGPVAPQVWIGSTEAPIVTSSPTQIECSVPPCPLGLVQRPVWVVSGNLSSQPTTIGTAEPVITGVTPSSSALSGGVRLTLTGSNFGEAERMRVRFNGGAIEVPVTGATETEIRTVSPAGSSSGPITLDVVSVEGLASPATTLDYTGPDVANASPSVIKPGGGQVITIFGSNFGANAGRVFRKGGYDSPVVEWTSGQLRVQSPAREDTSPLELTVESSEGTRSDPLTIDWAAPTISSVSPPEGRAAGGTPITIYGDNFSAFTTTSMGGAPLPADDQQLGSIVCHTPPGSGSVQVVVDNMGVGAASWFTYLQPPTVESVSPASGHTDGIITIHGTNFPSSMVTRTIMSLGDGPGTFVTPVSATECRALIPVSATVGTFDVHLAVDEVTATLPNGFTYGAVAATPQPPAVPRSLALAAGPNPFASSLSFRITLPVASPWTLDLYDAAGARARRFAGHDPAGERTLVWDGRRTGGGRAAPGLYLARLVTESGVIVKRVIKVE